MVCERAEGSAGAQPRGPATGWWWPVVRPPGDHRRVQAPFLGVGGALVVSAPPASGRPDRWGAEGRSCLGLGVPSEVRSATYGGRAVEACPARYPRRIGVPAKRPLF